MSFAQWREGEKVFIGDLFGGRTLFDGRSTHGCAVCVLIEESQ